MQGVTWNVTVRDLLPAAAAVGGLLLGAVIGELRTVLQGVREAGSARRRLLYELLEIRFRIGMTIPDEAMATIHRYLIEKVGAEAATQVLSHPAMRELQRELPRLFTIAALPDHLFAVDYQAAVTALAPHDPLLAYRLRNSGHLLALDRMLKAYYDEALSLPLLSNDPEATNLRSVAEQATLMGARRNALKDLAENILELVPWWRWVMRLRVSRSLRHQVGRLEPEDERRVEEMLDALLAEVTKPGAGT
jgi:hypothetical protein